MKRRKLSVQGRKHLSLWRKPVKSEDKDPQAAPKASHIKKATEVFAYHQRISESERPCTQRSSLDPWNINMSVSHQGMKYYHPSSRRRNSVTRPKLQELVAESTGSQISVKNSKTLHLHTTGQQLAATLTSPDLPSSSPPTLVCLSRKHHIPL